MKTYYDVTRDAFIKKTLEQLRHKNKATYWVLIQIVTSWSLPLLRTFQCTEVKFSFCIFKLLRNFFCDYSLFYPSISTQ